MHIFVQRNTYNNQMNADCALQKNSYLWKEQMRTLDIPKYLKSDFT